MKTIKYYINAYADYQQEAVEEAQRQLTTIFGEVEMVEVFNVEDIDPKTVIIGDKMSVETAKAPEEKPEKQLVVDPEYQGNDITVFEGCANIAGKDRAKIAKETKLSESGLSAKLIASALDGGFETLNKVTVGVNGIEVVLNEGTKRRIVNARAAHLLRQQIQHKLDNGEEIVTVTVNDTYKAHNVISGIEVQDSLAQFIDLATTTDYDF